MTYIFHSNSGTEIAEVSNNLATRWGSVCHHQPVMENTAVFITEGTNQKTEGTCRRCGRWGDIYYLTNI